MGQEVAKVKKILRQQIREAMAELTDQERAWSDGELIQRFLEQLSQTFFLFLFHQLITVRQAHEIPSHCPQPYIGRQAGFRVGPLSPSFLIPCMDIKPFFRYKQYSSHILILGHCVF